MPIGDTLYDKLEPRTPKTLYLMPKRTIFLPLDFITAEKFNKDFKNPREYHRQQEGLYDGPKSGERRISMKVRFADSNGFL